MSKLSLSEQNLPVTTTLSAVTGIAALPSPPTTPAVILPTSTDPDTEDRGAGRLVGMPRILLTTVATTRSGSCLLVSSSVASSAGVASVNVYDATQTVDTMDENDDEKCLLKDNYLCDLYYCIICKRRRVLEGMR